jgi:hypothetical protein
MTEESWNEMIERFQVGRFGDIEEVADVALMLAHNAYITAGRLQNRDREGVDAKSCIPHRLVRKRIFRSP